MSALPSAGRATARMSRAGAYLANVIRGGKPLPEKRMTTGYVINLLAISGFVMVFALNWITSTWSLGLATQLTKCLPGTVYLITKSVPERVERGRVIAYASKGLRPLLDDGRVVVKVAAAVPGDVVVVDENGVSINGTHWGALNPSVMAKTKKTLRDVKRTYKIADGELFVLGTMPRTYDSRYWGPIKHDQVIGTARKIW